MNYLIFYINKDFDTEIEITENLGGENIIRPFGFISQAYLMKGDVKNAELNINKAIRHNATYTNLAIKAYILKITESVNESIRYYEIAKSLCQNNKEKNTVEKIYKNFVEYENNKINALRLKQNWE